MTAVWKWSSDSFDKAERFPLPIISVTSGSLKDTTAIVCANTALQGIKLLAASRFYDAIQNTEGKLLEFSLYYVNPVSNTIIGYYADLLTEDWSEAIYKAGYGFAISSLPTLTIELPVPMTPFEC